MCAASKTVKILLGVTLVICAISVTTLYAQETTDAALEDDSHSSPWRGGMRFSGGIGIPFGEFYRVFTWGPGAGIEIIIPATTHTSVRLGVSRVGIDDNADSIVGDFRSVIEDNLVPKIWKISAAAEYRSWPSENGRSGPMYFLFGGAGILRHTLDGYYIVLNESTEQRVRLEADDEVETRFVILAGAGGMLNLGGNIGWDVTGEVNLLVHNNHNRTGSFYSKLDIASIVEFKTGLVVLF